MEVSTLIRELWEKFKALIEGRKPSEPEPLAFARIPEAGSWRTGIGLWSGVLPLFSTRIYYLEISRTSIADKRELGIKPPPSHTFKAYYFSKSEFQNQSITVFLVYQNCYLAGSSEDFIAVEILGKAISRQLQSLCSRSYSGASDLTESEVISRPGQLPRIRLKEGSQGIPAVVLLNRATTRTQAHWQTFIDTELQKVKDEQLEKAKKKGFR